MRRHPRLTCDQQEPAIEPTSRREPLMEDRATSSACRTLRGWRSSVSSPSSAKETSYLGAQPCGRRRAVSQLELFQTKRNLSRSACALLSIALKASARSNVADTLNTSPERRASTGMGTMEPDASQTALRVITASSNVARLLCPLTSNRPANAIRGAVPNAAESEPSRTRLAGRRNRARREGSRKRRTYPSRVTLSFADSSAVRCSFLSITAFTTSRQSFKKAT